jgi:hypothetical protein
MFEHQPIVDVLRELEAVQMMLPAEEQEFLQGCAYTAETGGALSQHNIQRIRQIYNNFQQAQHNTASFDKPVDMRAIMNKLAKSVHVLAPEERNVVVMAAKKLQAGGQLTAGEIEDILGVAKTHGL